MRKVQQAERQHGHCRVSKSAPLNDLPRTPRTQKKAWVFEKGKEKRRTTG